jgi:hypothetical protein
MADLNDLVGEKILNIELTCDETDAIREMLLHTENKVFSFFSTNPYHSIVFRGEYLYEGKVVEVILDPLAQLLDGVCAIIGILFESGEVLSIYWQGDHAQYLGFKEIGVE